MALSLSLSSASEGGCAGSTAVGHECLDYPKGHAGRAYSLSLFLSCARSLSRVCSPARSPYGLWRRLSPLYLSFSLSPAAATGQAVWIPACFSR